MKYTYSLAELEAMPTISQSQTDDLKLEFSTPHGVNKRLWLSRMTKEDGMEYDNQVTIEYFNTHRGQWLPEMTYQAE